ncbi:hypothetical protein H5300_25570, partial [Vibrio sp. SG41-7]|nr:hypothetical protein [Vibrio sp. SG41-7]
DALGIAPKDAPEMPGYAAMLKGYVKVDPFECILCGHRLTFLRFRAGAAVRAGPPCSGSSSNQVNLGISQDECI